MKGLPRRNGVYEYTSIHSIQSPSYDRSFSFSLYSLGPVMNCLFHIQILIPFTIATVNTSFLCNLYTYGLFRPSMPSASLWNKTFLIYVQNSCGDTLLPFIVYIPTCNLHVYPQHPSKFSSIFAAWATKLSVWRSLHLVAFGFFCKAL